MTKLEATVQPNRLDPVKEALIELGVENMTVSEFRGQRRQKRHTETYGGREDGINFLAKLKVELVLKDDLVDRAVDAIVKHAATGRMRDGKIFL